MKVTIFGATGRTGQELVSQALDRGFDVVAFARDSTKITCDDSRLAKVSGYLSNQEQLKAAILGSDAVLSALGPMGKPSDSELSDGIANIVAVMKECGVRRLVALSTTSAQDPSDQDNRRAQFKRDMIRRGRPTSYEQIVRYSQLIRDSDTDWTLVRIASILTSAPLSQQVSVGYVGKGRLRVTLSRANLAWFMLEQLTNIEHIKQAPALSN